MKKTDALSNKLCNHVSPGMRLLGRYASLDGEFGTASEMDLVKDTFWGYYASTPLLEEPPKYREINKMLMEWVRESPQYQSTAVLSQSRMTVSCRTAEVMAQFLLNDPEVQEALKKQAEAQALGEGGDEEGSEQVMQAAMKKLGEYLGTDDAKSVRGAAARHADDAGREAYEGLLHWGIEEGPGQRMTTDEIKDLLKRMNRQGLATIAELIGRAQAVAMRTRLTTSNIMPLVTNDAGYTRRVSDIFASQRAALMGCFGEERRTASLLEFSEHGLLGMKKSAEAARGGTLVFLVDGSGSMTSGMRNPLSKALAIGIGKAAEESGQNWYAAVFGTSMTSFVRHDDLVAVMNFATYIEGGGTNFVQALTETVRFIKTLPDEECFQADIVMITDMECDLPKNTVEMLQEARKTMGTRLFVLAVDTSMEPGRLKDVAQYIALINSADDIAPAAEGLSAALWNNSINAKE